MSFASQLTLRLNDPYRWDVGLKEAVGMKYNSITAKADDKINMLREADGGPHGMHIGQCQPSPS